MQSLPPLIQSTFMEGSGNYLVEIAEEMPITLWSCPTCTLPMGICLGILLKLVDVFIKSSARRYIAILAVKIVITVLYPFSSSFYRLLLGSSAKALPVFHFP